MKSVYPQRMNCVPMKRNMKGKLRVCIGVERSSDGTHKKMT
jgi:hypothetical protein